MTGAKSFCRQVYPRSWITRLDTADPVESVDASPNRTFNELTYLDPGENDESHERDARNTGNKSINGSRCRRASLRTDILVQMESVPGIVLPLDRYEPVVIAFVIIFYPLVSADCLWQPLSQNVGRIVAADHSESRVAVINNLN